MLSDINDTLGINNIFFSLINQKKGQNSLKNRRKQSLEKIKFLTIVAYFVANQSIYKAEFWSSFLAFVLVFLSGLVSSVSSLVVPFFQLLLWPFLAFTFTTEPPLLCYCFSGFSVSRVTAIEHVGMLYYALFY